MIPITKKHLELINIEELEDKKYKNLLLEQERSIKKNKQIIYNKASVIYYKKLKVSPRNKKYQLVCDFKRLENKLQELNNDQK